MVYFGSVCFASIFDNTTIILLINMLSIQTDTNQYKKKMRRIFFLCLFFLMLPLTLFSQMLHDGDYIVITARVNGTAYHQGSSGDVHATNELDFDCLLRVGVSGTNYTLQNMYSDELPCGLHCIVRCGVCCPRAATTQKL